MPIATKADENKMETKNGCPSNDEVTDPSEKKDVDQERQDVCKQIRDDIRLLLAVPKLVGRRPRGRRNSWSELNNTHGAAHSGLHLQYDNLVDVAPGASQVATQLHDIQHFIMNYKPQKRRKRDTDDGKEESGGRSHCFKHGIAHESPRSNMNCTGDNYGVELYSSGQFIGHRMVVEAVPDSLQPEKVANKKEESEQPLRGGQHLKKLQDVGLSGLYSATIQEVFERLRMEAQETM